MPSTTTPISKRQSGSTSVGRGMLYNFRKYTLLYVLISPGILYFLIFDYVPMYGVVIAFQNFKPFSGAMSMVVNPEWVGLQHFYHFFQSYYFSNLLQNTIMISLYKKLFIFPSAIILALLLNEVKHEKFKRIIQTITYLPHFLSWVIISGLIIMLLSPTTGLVNLLLMKMGFQAINFLGDSSYFRSVLVTSDLWASVGWGSIIYLAALAGIDPAQYESAKMDGANRFQQMLYISLPGISNVIAILFVMSMGQLLNVGFEQVLLLYSPLVYEVGDIIDTYVYREGLLSSRYSYAAAIGMFKNVVGLIFLLITNNVVKRMGKEGLW